MFSFKSIFLGLIGVAAVAVSSVGVFAATVDADGYPVFYLRGDKIAPGWKVDESYRFTREGNVYTLSVAELTGDFKVSNDDWTINFGGEDAGKYLNVSLPMRVSGILDGVNYHTESMKDLKIRFTYFKDKKTQIWFTDPSGEIPVKGLSGTLPVLYVNAYDSLGFFNDEIIDRNLSHKNYFNGEYWLDLNGCKWLADAGAKSVGSKDAPLPLEIKARGNYTRIGFSKKPFKLKLDKKQSLLGMTKSKHYAILAHADDNKGYLKNFTGFNLGKRIELPWTPAMQPVEVVINGDYRGLYFLTESIRVGDDRVPITELDDEVSDPALVSGGYLVELDNYDEENQIQMEEKGCVPGYKDKLRVTFDTPEVYSDLQRRFITDQFSAMNDFIGGNSDSLWSYMDLDDAARYYLVEEIISHVEAYHGSTYLFRDRGEGEKWHFSPLWDCGNAYNGPTNDFFYRHTPFGATWIPSMRMNEKFNAKVKETWLWFMSSKIEGFYDDINEFCDHIAEAAKADRKRWKDAPLPDNQSASAVVDNSDITKRKKEVTDHLQAKIEWLKGQFGDYASGKFSEPARDLTAAAPLPDYAKVSGIDEIDSDFGTEGEIEAIWNLQGLPVKEVVPGEIYLVKKGNRVEKRVFLNR